MSLYKEYEELGAQIEKLHERRVQILKLLENQRLEMIEEKGKEEEKSNPVDEEKRQEFIDQRDHRLQDFCKKCSCIMLNSKFDHNYVCWVCGEDSGRWGWDDDYGIVVCGGGVHVPKGGSYTNLRVDTGEDKEGEDSGDGESEEEYISCETIAKKMIPNIELGDYSPKAVYPCECMRGMGNMERAYHEVKKKIPL